MGVSENMVRTLFAARPFRVRIFLLLFVWLVVLSLSSADLFDLQDEVSWSLTDIQFALESDLEEVRDEAAPLRVDVEYTGAINSARSPLVHSAPLSSHRGNLPTHPLLSKLSVYRV